MNNRAKAEYLARKLFELGDEPGWPTNRIQFMIGPYEGERPGGGLIESSLADSLHHYLDQLDGAALRRTEQSTGESK